MSKQTALQFLKSELHLDWDDSYYIEVINKALQMEREQIQKAFVSGDNHGHYIEPSQYYNQTYGGQDE
jgi:hypothetical protein